VGRFREIASFPGIRAENLIAQAERGTIGRVSTRGALVMVKTQFGAVCEPQSLNRGDVLLHGREDAVGLSRQPLGRVAGLSVSVPAAPANGRSRQAMFSGRDGSPQANSLMNRGSPQAIFRVDLQ